MSLTVADAFEGRIWVALSWVTAEGRIFPEPIKPVTDILRVRRAFNVGPGVYNVLNLTKGYSCLVQFKAGEVGQKYARCGHENCIWQSKVQKPKPCKHMRAACIWHVKLARRTGITVAPTGKYEDGGTCGECELGILHRTEHRPGWEPQPGQRYYFEWWFRCGHCLNVFHDPRAKRPVEEWRSIHI